MHTWTLYLFLSVFILQLDHKVTCECVHTMDTCAFLAASSTVLGS